jgi:phenylacetate-CoA ligase
VALSRADVSNERGYAISSSPNWAGPLAEIFRNGGARNIDFRHADYAQLGEELSRKPCGYFISLPSHLLALRAAMGQEKFLKLRIEEFISTGQEITEELRDLCRESGIRVRNVYSCEEVGPIAFECGAYPGTLHIATSNVVVECDEPLQEVDGQRVGKLLITHLHSYATPFIRYEVGDLGALAPECPCGHRGPVISRLHGRVASMLRHRDGSLTSFQVGSRFLEDILPLKEYRIRQTALDKLVVEIVPLVDAPENAVERVGIRPRRQDHRPHRLGGELQAPDVPLRNLTTESPPKT